MRDSIPAAQEASYPFWTETACYKKQIQHANHARNHPIHDAVEKIEYGNGRYVIGVALDGVSETKSQKKLVPIGRMLAWDLARFCTEKAPEALEPMIEWFQETTRNPHFQGKGATTVALGRFDRQRGIIEGFNLGDSVALMVVEWLESRSGVTETKRRGAVLAPLHSVANDHSSVYKCWRYNVPFDPEIFRLVLPRDFTNVYLITMTDGFAKISKQIAGELYDYLRAERIIARRYPDFVRVFLPKPLSYLAPGVQRPKRGRVRYSAVVDNEELKQAVSTYFRQQASAKERLELSVVDLDTLHLRTLIAAAGDPNRKVLGKTIKELLGSSHRTLEWLTQAPYNDREDDRGLEGYLRQYLMAELFGEALVARVGGEGPPGSTLSTRLREFGEWLGPIADDFAVSIIKIGRSG